MVLTAQTEKKALQTDYFKRKEECYLPLFTAYLAFFLRFLGGTIKYSPVTQLLP